MDATTIETAIADSGMPARLVELDGRLIVLEMRNPRTEKLERVSLGTSEFCDVVLDWRARRAPVMREIAETLELAETAAA